MPNAAAYEGLFDRAVRHRIALEHYAAGEVREMLRFIRQVERDTLRKVAALQIDPDLTRGERARLALLERLLRELRVIYAEGYRALERRALLGLDALAAFEAEFHSGSLAAALDDLDARTLPQAATLAAAGETGILVPTVAQLRATVRTQPMRGKMLAKWFADMATAHRDRIEEALRIGFIEGEGIPALTERVQTVSRINARGAEAVARTAVTQISAAVAHETYVLNADLVQEVEWVSVLDSRTTEICRSRDGNRYPMEDGPRPPAHIRCRSAVAPILADFPPPNRETYPEWLRRQSSETQDDILGATRARLFRDGALKLDQFVAKDGSSLTLAQIRRRHPDAFQRAGIPAP